MEKLKYLSWLCVLLLGMACTTSDDMKQIQGSMVFEEIGSHHFNINAENIVATITLTGPNNGEILKLENVPLYRTVEYTAKINANSTTPKTALFSNLVMLYEAEGGSTNNRSTLGKIQIDWIGYD